MGLFEIAILSHIPYCPGQAPMGARRSSTKNWGWVVTWRRCLLNRMKAAAQGNRKWSVHDAVLWDHYITTAAHSQEGSVGAVHAVSSSRQNAGEGPRSFTRGGQKPIKRGRGEGVPPQATSWKKNICYSFNFNGACSSLHKC